MIGGREGHSLQGRLDKGLAIMRQLGCMPTFLMREAALGTLANSMALERGTAGGRRGAHPGISKHRCGPGGLGPNAVLADKRGSMGPLDHRLLCLAPLACAVPAPIVRQAGMHTRDHRDLNATPCPTWGPWAGPCRPHGSWAGRGAKGGGTMTYRGRLGRTGAGNAPALRAGQRGGAAPPRAGEAALPGFPGIGGLGGYVHQQACWACRWRPRKGSAASFAGCWPGPHGQPTGRWGTPFYSWTDAPSAAQRRRRRCTYCGNARARSRRARGGCLWCWRKRGRYRCSHCQRHGWFAYGPQDCCGWPWRAQTKGHKQSG